MASDLTLLLSGLDRFEAAVEERMGPASSRRRSSIELELEMEDFFEMRRKQETAGMLVEE